MEKQLEVTVRLDRRDIENLSIQSAGATHIGTREYQQDSFEIGTGKGGISYGILCDGMGGLEDGEKASRAAVQVFSEALREMDPDCDIPKFLLDKAQKANAIVYTLPSFDGESGAFGTTLAAVVIDAGNLYWISVGDSRIYIIRGGEMAAVTRDHAYSMELAEQVKLGNMTEEEASSDPQRDALISYLGMDRLGLVDLSRNAFLLEKGDTVLICSDGLYRSLSQADIIQTIERYGKNINECAQVLPLFALDRSAGGQDNTTVILFRYT